MIQKEINDKNNLNLLEIKEKEKKEMELIVNLTTKINEKDNEITHLNNKINNIFSDIETKNILHADEIKNILSTSNIEIQKFNNIIIEDENKIKELEGKLAEVTEDKIVLIQENNS